MKKGTNSTRGVPVLHIAEGSPSYLAGVRQGDLVVSYNGQEVDSIEDYLAAMKVPSQNRLQVVEVLRNEERLTFSFFRSSDWVGLEKTPS